MSSGELKKANRMLWLFGVFKIPLIGFVRPKIVSITTSEIVVRIKLNRFTRNHLHSMYFGALAIGADISGAFQAFMIAEQRQLRMSIAFKNFKASFLMRPEGDVYFISQEGEHIQTMMEKAIATGERINEMVNIKAVTGYPDNVQEVATFELGLSVKHKPAR